MTAITLVRVSSPRAGAATYVAIPAARAVDLLAHVTTAFIQVTSGELCDDLDADTMPWETLPGAEPAAAAAIHAGLAAGRAPFAIIGTVVDGQWTSWYPPCSRPPVPAGGP